MIAKGSNSISLEEINSKYSDFDIAHKYFGITSIPEMISSPLREDNNPSMCIFLNNKTDSLWFKDFGNGDKGSIYDLLARMWNTDIKQVYLRIIKDIPVNNQVSNKTKSKIKVYKKSAGKIEVKVREWRNYDIDYWESYGISLPWLKYGDIYPISHIILNKNKISYPIAADKYAYVYIERKDNNLSFKIYQPYSKEYKWLSKHDSSVWDLWTKIPEKGDNLIITSSRKDALSIWSNTGIPSLSLQGEGYIPKEKVINQLKERYKNIYILYDNDVKSEENHGRIYGKTIADLYNLIQIEIPEEYGTKDPSDTVKKYGRKTLVTIINKLLNLK